MHWRDVLIRPIITEKTNRASTASQQYAFVVHNNANKPMVREAIEMAWPNVTVAKVRIANMPAKRGRRWRALTVRKAGYKKALVTLESGTIDLFEGV